MKTRLLFLIMLLAAFSINDLDAQAKRYALFEHFTQASCIPCAAQNPAFFARMDQNAYQTHLIAYHTWWPGFDPMYNENTADIRSIVPFYGINAVPNTVLNGELAGTPNNVSQDMIDNTGSSPLRVHIEETVNDQDPNMRDVIVQIESLGNVDADNLILRVVVVEELVEYITAPGSNGERDFPNVFRDFIGGGFQGDNVDPAPVGEVLEFNYSYEMEDFWDPDRIFCIAYVIDRVNKVVVNSGQENDAEFEIGSAFDRKYTEVIADGNNMGIRVEEMGTDTSTVIITYDFDQPDDWTTKLTYNGMEIDNGQNMTIVPGVTDLQLEVLAGETKAIGFYQVTVDQIGSPITETMIFNVISPVTDLVLTNNSGFVVPTGAPDIVQPFTAGLEFADNEAFMHLDEATLFNALDNDALGGVQNIYYSVGWTNEPLNNELATYLDEFLENGGNLMITGQDIGAYIMSGGVPATQRFFYLRTMNVLFDETGDVNNNTMTAVSDDPLFGNEQDGNVLPVYGMSNTSPDEITPKAGSHPIFYYNNEPEKIGGVRVERNGYKVVYLGVGLEQLNADFANQVVDIAHDWFYGVVSSNEFDRFFQDNGSRLFPNPAGDFVEISVPGNISPNTYVEIRDINGHLVVNVNCNDKTGKRIALSSFTPGIYTYQFRDEVGVYKAQKLMILR